jgi:hypothetical protein
VKAVLALVALCFILSSATMTPQDSLRFKDIKPIFDSKCVPCHGVEGPAGNFQTTSYEHVMRGGKHGKAVVAKNSGASRLIKMIKGSMKPRMPFESAPLTRAEIEKISKWVAQGAKQ